MQLRTKFRRSSRSAYAIIAFAVAVVAVLPAFAGQAFAYGQITSRSIQMSSSTSAATGTTYLVGFTETGSSVIKSVDIDFCSTDPIYGDSCTAPTGFSAASATLSAQTGTSGWTLTPGAAHIVISGTTTNSTAAITFTLANITNPSGSPGTFYARIYTYAAQSNDYSSVTSPGTVFDFGGIALSTAQAITITAKVQEQLSFCVYTSSCGTGSTVTLGNSQGVLSTTLPSVDKTTKYDIQTNAGSGAIVDVKGPLLTSGSNTIASINTAGASTYTAGTSEFGLCNFESAGSTITPFGNYTGGGAACNTSTTQGQGSGNAGTATYSYGTNAISGTYGDEISSDSAGATATGTIVMLAGVSTSQTAGIYTTTMQFIATGTF